MIYRAFFRLILQRIPAEAAHSLAAGALRILTALPGVRAALRSLLHRNDPGLEMQALGLRFPNPLGVAGGMDKDATWFEALGALGFGFVEVGTVTSKPQPGNPGKRVWRLPKDRAVLNRMGFPNPGAETVARRLRKRKARTIVGANVGLSRGASSEHAPSDYRKTAAELAPVADFLVLNVSSPNTPGLAELQTNGALRAVISAVKEELATARERKPLLLKIGPDLSNSEIDQITELALELKLDGIVATNTTTDRSGLNSDQSEWSPDGGISGAPLKERSLEVLRRLSSRGGQDLVLISVGGIETADDVWQRLLAGATLVQAHTAFVYGGPLWPSRINRDLAKRLRASGHQSLQSLIGALEDKVANEDRGGELDLRTSDAVIAGSSRS
jgi:dihydroorotate dehydrogenase